MLFIILFTIVYYVLMVTAYVTYLNDGDRHWISDFIYLFLIAGYPMVIFFAR